MIYIRKAKIEDAIHIVNAQREIAKHPGFFCSSPSELSEKSVKETIESVRGIYLVAEKDGILVGHAFLEQPTLQSLRHIAELNIAVHKGYQGQGIGTLLMQKIIAWAEQSDSVEKIELRVRASNIRAIALYKKMGFFEEGLLKRRVKAGDSYIDDLIMARHLKKNIPHQSIKRVGVYGVVREGSKIFSVTQSSGIYLGKFDLPGGGIEFGETIEEALHREFIEETGMDFKSMELLTNLTAHVEAPTTTFHQIGLLYSVTGLFRVNESGSLETDWIDINLLNKENTSRLC